MTKTTIAGVVLESKPSSASFTLPSGGRWTVWHRDVGGNALQQAIYELMAALCAQAPAVEPRSIARMLDLVSEYWDIAYAEGLEVREHDTEDGAANAKWNEIRAEARALASLPLQPQCQGDPGECAFNKACMYACGRSEPPALEGARP